MLQTDDLTPLDYAIPIESRVERFAKKPIRRVVYPVLNRIRHPWLARTYGKEAPLRVNRWLWGQRGNDYATHRRRVNRLLPLKRKRILVAGCGTGEDIYTWLSFKPEAVTGVDILNYRRAWNLIEEYAEERFPESKLDFIQADASNIQEIPDCIFDVVASDAFLEHVSDLAAVVQEFHRVLKPGGILYGTYGPLWYCWGGDHISGYDGLSGGYNHLLLEAEEYKRYLEAAGPFTHSKHDGRTWILQGFFAYLKPDEYLDVLASSGFRQVYTAAVIDPRASQFAHAYGKRWDRLNGLVSNQIDLHISGMTVIYKSE